MSTTNSGAVHTPLIVLAIWMCPLRFKYVNSPKNPVPPIVHTV
ncbi:MAG: hypothetical protein SF123_22780 [Chloroflexota bacterium]|nr:hypothetical protein [Chloroflexota bacterium]